MHTDFPPPPPGQSQCARVLLEQAELPRGFWQHRRRRWFGRRRRRRLLVARAVITIGPYSPGTAITKRLVARTTFARRCGVVAAPRRGSFFAHRTPRRSSTVFTNDALKLSVSRTKVATRHLPTLRAGGMTRRAMAPTVVLTTVVVGFLLVVCEQYLTVALLAVERTKGLRLASRLLWSVTHDCILLNTHWCHSCTGFPARSCQVTL